MDRSPISVLSKESSTAQVNLPFSSRS